MKIALTQDTPTSRQWSVKVPAPGDFDREYRVTSYWHIGSMRKEWLVEVCVNSAQVQTHWRQIKGRWLIDAVMEWQHKAASAA